MFRWMLLSIFVPHISLSVIMIKYISYYIYIYIYIGHWEKDVYKFAGFFNKLKCTKQSDIFETPMQYTGFQCAINRDGVVNNRDISIRRTKLQAAFHTTYHTNISE